MRVEDNKGRSTFYDKSCNTVLLATTNVWDNIEIVKIYIVKYNLISVVIRYLDIEILDCCFRDTSDKIIYDVAEDVEDVKKNYFPTKKHNWYNYTFGKIY